MPKSNEHVHVHEMQLLIEIPDLYMIITFYSISLLQYNDFECVCQYMEVNECQYYDTII